MPARSPAVAISAGRAAEVIGTSWFTEPFVVTSLVIMEARSHRRFGRKTLGAGFVEVVAALGTGVPVILPSLMIGIDQGIVGERQQTFGEASERVLLCGGEHLLRGKRSARAPVRRRCD